MDLEHEHVSVLGKKKMSPFDRAVVEIVKFIPTLVIYWTPYALSSALSTVSKLKISPTVSSLFFIETNFFF